MSRAFVGLMVLAGAWLMVVGDGGRSEQRRLRSHFDSVVVELAARDVRGLTGAQRSSRSQLIGWLAEYRDEGRFPVNDRYAQVPTPIFRDARGATCAMAYLIERSGRPDIVNDVSATRNLAYIRELADDSRLVAWLDSVGLDAAEAARIQPAYERDTKHVHLTAVTLVLSGASLATAARNVLKPTELMGFIGLAAGGLTLLAAGAMSTEPTIYPAINVVSGSLAVLTGMYAAFRPRPVQPTKGEKSARQAIDWTPLVLWSPRTGQARAGMEARF